MGGNFSLELNRNAYHNHALPLNRNYLQKGNTAFIDQNGEIIPDQWHYLASIQKISENKIEQILGKIVLTLPVEVKQESQKQAETKTESAVEKPEIRITQGAEARMII